MLGQKKRGGKILGEVGAIHLSGQKNTGSTGTVVHVFVDGLLWLSGESGW